MHHGVIGQKWGVRRYQPYGEGGYNPEHKGKFTGKEQKATYKHLKERYANFQGHNSDVVKAFRGTDRYKQQAKNMKRADAAFNKATSYEDKAHRELRKRANKSGFDKDKYEQYIKEQDKYEKEYERLKKEGKDAMAADAKKYIKDVLGRYRKKKVKEIRNDAAVEVGLERVNVQRLSDLLYEDLVTQYDYIDISGR